jgi:hypothetical protein
MTAKKNLIQSRDTYNRYYGDFRGVDFSSDHTQVLPNRFAYLVNMYKDYQSGQGQAVETIPGFRRRFVAPDSERIHALHEFKGECLVHAGTHLYKWDKSKTVNVEVAKDYVLEEPEVIGENRLFTVTIDDAERIVHIYDAKGHDYGTDNLYSSNGGSLTFGTSEMNKGDHVTVYYYEQYYEVTDSLCEMNNAKSVSFVMNNRLYILDGNDYLYYDGTGVYSVLSEEYVPTTWINAIVGGENADGGTEYEQRNLLTPDFINTFVPDGVTATYRLSERDLDDVLSVSVYGETLKSEHYDVNVALGEITFKDGHIPPVSERLAEKLNGLGKTDVNEKSNDADVSRANGYPDEYAGVKITAKKTYKSVGGATFDNISDAITKCTIATVFDNRVFLSGNPEAPNHVFYCGFTLGHPDPSYFGVLDYVQDGVGSSPITAMMPVASTLLVLKADTEQDGCAYFHTPTETGNGVIPKIYPSAQGLSGIGCLGASTNFRDDPCFISRLGVEAVGQLSVRNERGIEHRSSLVDAVLRNCNLSDASMCEWNGYLVVLVDGKIFLADSRQKYQHEIGVPQYEWYYLEGIGVYYGQKTEYTYAQVPTKDIEVDGHPLLTSDKEGEVNGDVQFAIDGTWVIPYVIEDGKAYFCSTKGNKTGGTFCQANVVKSMDDNLFFGTINGVVCSFNFDKRVADGSIPTGDYTFDGRTILCGCATLMDSCGIPHLTKKTVKKSMVVKTKSFMSSVAKIKVRTNRKPYTQVARINSAIFPFDNIDFSDFSFNLGDKSLFTVNEKEKKWVEKQLYVYSDEYMKPFALHYISYRYQIAGRYKE